jgi:hypothetical protein
LNKKEEYKMAEEISNRTLAILLVVAIAISLGGTIVSLNRLAQVRMPEIIGMATDTDTGTATINITSQASLIFVTGWDAIAFGNGWINSTEDSGICHMTAVNSSLGTTGAACKGNWDTLTASGFVIENDGNVNLSVELESDKNSTEFLGVNPGTNNMGFRFMTYNNETGSCANVNASVDDEWVEWPDADAKTLVCNTIGGLGYTDNNDSMAIAINLSIDYRTNNTGAGTQTATITATGTSI